MIWINVVPGKGRRVAFERERRYFPADVPSRVQKTRYIERRLADGDLVETTKSPFEHITLTEAEAEAAGRAAAEPAAGREAAADSGAASAADAAAHQIEETP